MNTRFLFAQRLCYATTLLFVVLATLPWPVHAQSEIGFPGLRIGMGIAEAQSTLAKQGITVARSRGKDAYAGRELLEFDFIDPTTSLPIFAIVDFKENDLSLDGIVIVARDSDQKQYQAWYSKFHGAKKKFDFVDLRGRTGIGSCVFSNLSIRLTYGADGFSMLTYETLAKSDTQCIEGPYLGNRAAVAYSFAPAPVTPTQASTTRSAAVNPDTRMQKLKYGNTKFEYQAMAHCYAESTIFSAHMIDEVQKKPRDQWRNIDVSIFATYKSRMAGAHYEFEPLMKLSREKLGISVDEHHNIMKWAFKMVGEYFPKNDNRDWKKCPREAMDATLCSKDTSPGDWEVCVR